MKNVKTPVCKVLSNADYKPSDLIGRATFQSLEQLVVHMLPDPLCVRAYLSVCVLIEVWSMRLVDKERGMERGEVEWREDGEEEEGRDKSTEMGGREGGERGGSKVKHSPSNQACSYL